MKHEIKHEELMKNGEISRFKCTCCAMIFHSKELCVGHQQTAHVDELSKFTQFKRVLIIITLLYSVQRLCPNFCEPREFESACKRFPQRRP